jgi:hypothetical protein
MTDRKPLVDWTRLPEAERKQLKRKAHVEAARQYLKAAKLKDGKAKISVLEDAMQELEWAQRHWLAARLRKAILKSAIAYELPDSSKSTSNQVL